jgi:hypothetical protein
MKTHPRFVGQFQRMFARFLRASSAWSQWISREQFQSILTFALGHPEVLGYEMLLQSLISDFPDAVCAFLDIPRVELFGQFGRLAACHARAMRETVAAAPLNIEFEHFENPWARPLNWKEMPVPWSRHVFAANATCAAVREKIDAKLGPFEPFVDDGGEEEGEARAYLLLTAMAIIISESPIAVIDFRSVNGHLDLRAIEPLLVCGVVGGGRSMVSVQAFRLLDWIVNGISDTEVASIADEPIVHAIVADFAECFRFSIDVTPQMVAAFPLFCGHRYADLGRGEHAAVAVELAGGRQFERATVTGTTPLEFYGSFLCDEPPLSDGFSRAILSAAARIAQNGERLRDSENVKMLEADPAEYQRMVIEADLPFHDFIQAKWDGGEANMRELVKYFPSPSALQLPKIDTARVHMNRFVVELARLWAKRNPFRLVNGKILPGIEELALPDDLVAQITDYVEMMEALELNELWEFNRSVR